MDKGVGALGKLSGIGAGVVTAILAGQDLIIALGGHKHFRHRQMRGRIPHEAGDLAEAHPEAADILRDDLAGEEGEVAETL